MGYVILIAIIIAIIYGIIKLIIFLAPYIGIGILIILGAGGVVGLLVGFFYAVKNYIFSIRDNIHNKIFKILMMVITSIVILIITYFLLSRIWYTFRFWYIFYMPRQLFYRY